MDIDDLIAFYLNEIQIRLDCCGDYDYDRAIVIAKDIEAFNFTIRLLLEYKSYQDSNIF